MICYGCKRDLPMSKFQHRVYRAGQKRWVCSWCHPLEVAKHKAAQKKYRASQLTHIVEERRK